MGGAPGQGSPLDGSVGEAQRPRAGEAPAGTAAPVICGVPSPLLSPLPPTMRPFSHWIRKSSSLMDFSTIAPVLPRDTLELLRSFVPNRNVLKHSVVDVSLG